MRVGDKVFLKAVGNMARGRKETYIVEYKIEKIGRIYFEVCQEGYESVNPIKFKIEDRRQHTEYSPDWKVYFSMQEILDEEEVERLSSKLREKFGSFGRIDLTLDQLRRISRIVNESK